MTNARNLHRPTPSRQRGVVLFVALIAMVILSLAGLALMRSVDESSGVAGNIAFRHSSMNPVNESIEEAIQVIFKAKTLPSQTADHPDFHYFAQLRAGESKGGVPDVLRGSYAAMVSAYSGAGIPAPVADAVTGTELRYVVERVCNFPAVTQQEIIGHCDILPPKVPLAGTDNKYKPITLPPIPIFRVTVRADIPNTNAPSYAQAFVR
jgi:Tfp pilus assembly protein PilX